MAGPDIVLFVVGALLFGGATFAIVKTEGGSALGVGGSGSGVYTVTYATKDVDAKGADIPDVASGSAAFPVASANVGAIVVTFDCADPASQVSQFTYTVKVDGPKGQTQFTKSSCGNGKSTVTIPISSKPADTTASGNTEADAANALPPTENATAAQGQWKVTITGARSTPAPVPLAGTPAEPSGHIDFKAQQWAPKLTPLGK